MKTSHEEIPGEHFKEIMAVAGKIVNHTNRFQADTIERIEQVENHIIAVEKEVTLLKEKS